MYMYYEVEEYYNTLNAFLKRLKTFDERWGVGGKNILYKNS